MSDENTSEAYLTFDLRAISDSVEKATLKLYPVEVFSSQDVVHEAAVANVHSTDGSITWENRPSVEPAFSSWKPVQDSLLLIDMTAEVRQALKDKVDLSIRLASTQTSDSSWVLYASSNNASFGIQPTLRIWSSKSDSSNSSTKRETSSPINLDAFSLEGNYPNPFRESTNIILSVPRADIIMVEVFDILGRKVYETAPLHVPSGVSQKITIDALSLAPGIYVYAVKSFTRRYMRRGKMVITK